MEELLAKLSSIGESLAVSLAEETNVDTRISEVIATTTKVFQGTTWTDVSALKNRLEGARNTFKQGESKIDQAINALARYNTGP